jgi:hypothetical protein
MIPVLSTINIHKERERREGRRLEAMCLMEAQLSCDGDKVVRVHAMRRGVGGTGGMGSGRRWAGQLDCRMLVGDEQEAKQDCRSYARSAQLVEPSDVVVLAAVRRRGMEEVARR